MLDISYSPYWLILCLSLGLGYAFLLYNKHKGPWKPIWNKVLFVLRTIAITLIAYLLLEPFLNIRRTESEDSNIVFLIDDSESVNEGDDNFNKTFSSILQLKEKLEDEKGVHIPILNLKGDIITSSDSLEGFQKSSPLNQSLKNISDLIDEALISRVVLFSDGIYNQGISPDYYAFPFELSTVGLGDTVQKKDVVLKEIRYNKVAYQGNEFPIEVDILQSGFDNQVGRVKLLKEGKTIDQEVINFIGNDNLSTVQFLVSADDFGFQSYTVRVEALEGEFIQENNSKNAYVNIIEGKKKILFLAPYPHPDIKALTASLDQNTNYEYELNIASVNKKQLKNIAEYDLAILFHLPNRNNVFISEIRKIANANIPIWFVNGPNMAFNIYNEVNKSTELRPSAEVDEAFAYINPKFDLFQLENEKQEIQSKLPPVYLPYVKHQFHPLAQSFMMKRVGNVKTQQPIFVFYKDDQTRQATLLAQNFRVWRMVEYLNTERHDFFDSWVSKTIQYLTANNKRDLFKVFPIKDAFLDNEMIKFNVELYNEVFDRIFDVPISLILKNEKDSILNYEFTPDRLKPNFDLGTLAQGVYDYTATGNLQGVNYTSSGQFVVDQFDIEKQNLKANFNLLRRVAQKNNGKFYKVDELSSLESDLMANDYPKVLSGESEVIPITQNIIPYIIILILLFSEWFIRRFFGSY
ncbi:hypothetical protein QYS48_08755 [Marivirga arenosa]|uniref:VWFA domain-containing protein n=1 Tax=Marivirga arenosa TaxID=3059076 RepID=A0AA49JAI2_9BACT|nr:hypothetical protein [Marivirga sp. ABR2-2]WKK86923.2 hypothetical protein QYS48_08755 [Marivirga sp. ABR2-2]